LVAAVAAGGDETAAGVAVVIAPALACGTADGDEPAAGVAVVVAPALACGTADSDEPAAGVAVVVAPALACAAAGDETAVRPPTTVRSSSKTWLTLVPRMLQPHISTHLINARQKCEPGPICGGWSVSASASIGSGRSAPPTSHSRSSPSCLSTVLGCNANERHRTKRY